MIQRLTALLIAIAVCTSPASAVVVSFEATYGEGDPLPNATIEIGGAKQQTDDQGRAELDVAFVPGERTRVVVRHGDQVVFDELVRLDSDRPVVLRTSALLFPDGFESGDTSAWSRAWGRVQVSGIVGTERIEPHLDSQSVAVETRIGGTVVPEGTQSGTTSPEELREINASEEKRHEIPLEAGVVIDIRLPSFGSRAGANFVRGLSLDRGPDGGGRTTPPYATVGAGGAQNGAQERPPGGWRIYPALTLGVTQADVEFHSLNLVDDSAATFDGDGLRFRGGVHGTLSPCGTCRWFGRLAYEYTRTEDIEMTRSPGLEASVPDGIRIAQDRVVYQARSHAVRLTAGRAFRHVTPWLGVEAQRWHGDLDFDILLEAGVDAQQSQSARNEYEEDLVLGIAGVQVRFPRSRVAFWVAGNSDGDNYAASAGVGVGLGGKR